MGTIKSSYTEKTYPVGREGFNIRKINWSMEFIGKEPISDFELKVINYGLHECCAVWQTPYRAVQDRAYPTTPLQNIFTRYLFVQFLNKSLGMGSIKIAAFIRRTKRIVLKIKKDPASRKMHTAPEVDQFITRIKKKMMRESWFIETGNNLSMISHHDQKIYLKISKGV